LFVFSKFISIFRKMNAFQSRHFVAIICLWGFATNISRLLQILYAIIKASKASQNKRPKLAGTRSLAMPTQQNQSAKKKFATFS